MSFDLRTDSITNKTGDGSVNLDQGATIPSDKNIVSSGNINATGISTVGFLSVTNASVGIVTATTFVGDGSGLTQISGVSIAKSIALRSIIGDPPLRS